jgi:hypothetical protein
MTDPHTPKADCPYCGRSSLPVLWGKPSKEGEKWAQEGKVILGGCRMSTNSPSHQCSNGHSFITEEVKKEREAAFEALLARRKARDEAK